MSEGPEDPDADRDSVDLTIVSMLAMALMLGIGTLMTAAAKLASLSVASAFQIIASAA